MANPSIPIVKLNSLHALVPIKEEQPSQQALTLPTPLREGKMSAIHSPGNQPPPQPQPLQQEQPKETQYFKPINELCALSAVIQEFKLRFDELKSHLDFITNTVDSGIKDYLQKKETGVEAQLNLAKSENENESVPETESSEIQHLCKTMCSKSLRKYIVTKLSELGKLREEVPAALKLAPAPGKLVLECIGRFYLQGKRAYTTDSPMIPAREASVLTLEFFLLMMRSCGEAGVQIDKSLKEEAEAGAIAWRKRLVNEGGLVNACEIDARGLLLLIASYGIPKAFGFEDIVSLFRLANSKEISDALKGSRVLLSRIPDIINGMVKGGMPVEAIDIALVMGVEDKFSPQTILTSFLQDFKQAFNKKKLGHNSPVVQKEGKEKQLGALRSIVKYVESSSGDLTKILAAWQIKDKIVKLEKEIANDKKKAKSVISKRRFDEMGSSSQVWHSQEIKRPKVAAKGSASLISPHVNGLDEQRLAIYADSSRSYESVLQSSSDIAIAAHVNSYRTASPSPYVSSAGGIHAAAFGGGVAIAAGALAANSYSLAHREAVAGQVAQFVASRDQAYGWHDVEARYDMSVYDQSSLAQSASVAATSAYLPSDSYGALQDYTYAAAASRTSASDLYRFADTVVEAEPHSSSIRPGSVPSVVHARPFLYPK